jgi:hypothetical protein
MSTTKRQSYRGSSSSSAANPYVQLVQDRSKLIAQELYTTVNGHIKRAQSRPMEEHIVTAASGLLLALLYRYLSMEKGQHFITLSLLINALVFIAITTVIQGHSVWHQYSGCVVVFSLMLQLHLIHSSPLLLAALPLLIDQLKITIVKTAQKVK